VRQQAAAQEVEGFEVGAVAIARKAQVERGRQAWPGCSQGCLAQVEEFQALLTRQAGPRIPIACGGVRVPVCSREECDSSAENGYKRERNEFDIFFKGSQGFG